MHNFVYAVEQTLDSYKFNLLLNKSIFINQIKSNQLGVRKIDEGGMDEANGMNYAEYCAILSGNTLLLDKAKLERELRKIESEKFMFLKDQKQADEKITGLEISLGLNENRKETLINDHRALLGHDFDFKTDLVSMDKYQLHAETLEAYLYKNLAIIFDKKDFDVKTEKELGRYLVGLKNGINSAGITEIGLYAGFRMYLETLLLRDYDNRVSLEHSLFLQGKGSEKYTYNGGMLANTPEIAVQYPQKALLKIPVLLESVEQNIINLKKNISDLKKFIQEDFKGETELQAVKKEMELLKGKIDRTMEKGEKSLSSSQMDIEEKGVGVRVKGVGIG